MTTITCYLDFISPYAYLAFEALPKTLQACSYEVRYKPILFGALLQHHGQLGPAEFAPKRDWTYRQVLWLAQQLQVPLDMPAAHPFNPIALLRLALGAACADDLPSRRVCEQIFHHVWRGGALATDPDRLSALQAQLEKQGQLRRDPQSPEVKDQLKRLTQEAIDAGVFGVPTFEVDGKLFWGLDALPMLRDYLQNDAWFQGSAWSSVSQIQVGIERKR
jgi:2-hydroxychromene-2-carboxylate isomerase